MPYDDNLQSANFNRPPRLHRPQLQTKLIEIPAPPAQPELPDQNLLITVLPVLGIGVMAIFYVLRAAAGGLGSSLLFAIPLLILAIFVIAATVLAHRWRRKDHEKRTLQNELNYIRALQSKRARLQAAQDAQIALLNEVNLPPENWLQLALARDLRLWERRPGDADFMQFRVGVGTVPSGVQIKTPDPDLDNPLLDRAFSLADDYRLLDAAPVVISLAADIAVGVYGKRTRMLPAVRAMICHLAMTHAPQELHIHLLAPQASYDDWQWLEWLPHTSVTHQGGIGDLLAFDGDQIRNLLGNLSQIIDERKAHKDVARLPHLLVVMDGPHLAESEPIYNTLLREGDVIGASALCLVSRFEYVPQDCRGVIAIADEDGFEYIRSGESRLQIPGEQIDQLSAQDSEHIARALAAVVMRESGSSGRIPRRVDFLDLYGVRYVHELKERIRARWAREIQRGILPHPVPIGRESLAVATSLHLDEDHHGPHGVLAGTTGSGKSELLQTLVCSLALEHDPRLINLLLIDFKGGSSFNVFEGLPHVVGAITNLDGGLIARALEALRAEIHWRQQFLERMNVRDITQYYRYYIKSTANLEQSDYTPLPHLFILVDEFAQLARELPDFMRELVRIAQVGRSLGLHLILGTQSPMDVITDEMNANLQFRICLRVQNIEASRAMLRRPDAAYLPAGWAGRGYFQVGERGLFKQFQTAFVGADYQPPLEDDSAEEMVLEIITDHGEAINLLPEIHTSYPAGVVPPEIISEPYTVAKAIVETIQDFSEVAGITPAPPILLPPLPDQITLKVPFSSISTKGWDGRNWEHPGYDAQGNSIQVGSAPVGMVDDIYSRTQHPLWVHLNTVGDEGSGHLIVVGSPGTGKTTVIRTLALAQAMLHSPDHLHLYFLSFTGTGLNELGKLPHAEQVVYGSESERVRRLFGRLIQTLDARQADVTSGKMPIIILCLDQYEQFRDSYRDQHHADFERLLNEGRAVGIYVVITLSNIAAMPDRLRSLVQQRIALQLAESGDYTLAVGRIRTQFETYLPGGRGYIYSNPPLVCQVSLPSMQEYVESPAAASDDLKQLVSDMKQSYRALTGRRQSPAHIEELPRRIPLEKLPPVDPTPAPHIITPLGRYDDDSLSLFTLDWWESGGHFIVTGSPGSGKTNLLRTAILSAAAHYSPQDVRFLLVDFNGRNLRGLRDLKHCIRHITDTLTLQAQLVNLSSEMNAFYAQVRQHESDGLPPPKLPATVIIIDDYDATSEALIGSEDLLRSLRDHVRLHSDLGLSVWVAGYLERTADPLIKLLLLRRTGFALGVRESLQRLNLRVTGLPLDAMPQGRAYFPQGNQINVVQTAIVDDLATMVQHLNNDVWLEQDRAHWLHPASKAQILGDVATAGDAGDTAGNRWSLDIDTAGLIDDLLGGQVDESRGDE